MSNPPCRVGHINGDPLDNRRENLKIIRSKKDERMDFIDEPVDKEKIKKSLTPGDYSRWEIGVYGGSINRGKGYWIVRFQSPYLSKVFNFNKCGGEMKSKNEAESFRQEEAVKRGLIWNKYRTCTTPEKDVYLEVRVMHKNEETSFYCDMEDQHLLKRYKWHIRKRTNSRTMEVVTSADNHKRFHSLLGIARVVDHIDGNPLNNRRCNLRDGEKNNARNYPKRKDNASGTTGVSFNNSKNAYVIQWQEEGRRRCKQFTVIEGKRSKEEAYELAKTFRLEIDERLNLHIQQHL